MLIVAPPPAMAAPTPPVRGGYTGKPFPTVLHGRKLLCTTHLYSDGLIVRCILTTKGTA